jgi:sugar/nucleoside kinase (ribokinase family)
MNFWINSKLDNLKALLGKIDVLLINEGEAKLLTKSPNAIAAAKVIAKMGPKAIVIKRGEYGFVLFTENQYFMLPAFPIAEVVDPTGAGDTFAGGFFGYLAKNGGTTKIQDLKQACIHGSLMASFTVEGFGVTRLKTLTQDQVNARSVEYKKCVDLSL